MKHELELKVQAWLDGEMPDREAQQFGQWVARDPEASALAAELGGVRQAMLHHEAACALGESREFYWSKIERQIQREAAHRPPAAAPWLAFLRRYMGPLTGVAALACVLMLAVIQSATPGYDEISSTGEEMEAVTFHDQSAQMTVVWLQDSSAASEEQTVPESIPYEDEPGTVIDL